MLASAISVLNHLSKASPHSIQLHHLEPVPNHILLKFPPAKLPDQLFQMKNFTPCYKRKRDRATSVCKEPRATFLTIIWLSFTFKIPKLYKTEFCFPQCSVSVKRVRTIPQTGSVSTNQSQEQVATAWSQLCSSLLTSFLWCLTKI